MYTIAYDDCGKPCSEELSKFSEQWGNYVDVRARCDYLNSLLTKSDGIYYIINHSQYGL